MEWEAMEIEPRYGHRGGKFFRNCGTHIMLCGIKIQETVIWVTLAMKI